MLCMIYQGREGVEGHKAVGAPRYNINKNSRGEP